MSSRYIGLTAAACGVAGAALSLARLRTFAAIPRLFFKADRGGTVPVTEPGNARTAIVVALLWGVRRRPRHPPPPPRSKSRFIPTPLTFRPTVSLRNRRRTSAWRGC